jgi:hypothetical protein
MYGQTEATARMGYLPPDLARTRPNAVGMAIPGGRFRIDEPDHDGIGELVYSGPNVMLGYAESVTDLAQGRTTAELHTGDLARIAEDGLVEVVGRRNRAAKILGLRVDLDRVERLLADEGVPAACVELDERLLVAAEVFDTGPVIDLLRSITGLPSWAVAVIGVPDLPRTPNGKPCYAAVAGLGRAPTPTAPSPQHPDAASEDRADVAALRALYAELLGRDAVTDASSFVSLEGDSLSYVEVSIRLEQALGTLPSQWPTMTIGELAAASAASRQPTRRPAWWRVRSLETNVLLRAIAIVLIVGSHANVFALAGGAHVLLGAAGFNMARFHLTEAGRRDRLRHLTTSILRVAVPSIAVIGAMAAVAGDYPWSTVLLVNGMFGPDQWTEPEWYFWFIEAIVWALVAVTAVLAIPAVDRLERRQPFWLAVGFVSVALLPRYGVLGAGEGGDRIHAAFVVGWLFALGWAAAKASSVVQRLVVSILVVVTLPGFFDDLQREALIAAGMLLLVWVPSVRVPRFLVPVLGLLAASSLYIYLIHWQVYPWLEYRWPVLALLSSLVVGVACARLVGPLAARLDRLLPAPRLRPHDSEPGGDRSPVRR